MKRVKLQERPHWRALAEKNGFRFHTIDGEPYWDETKAYRFSLRQIEDDLEDPTGALEEMCLEAVSRVIRNEELLKQLRIPPEFWSVIKNSWDRKEKNLYGRFDLSYNGEGPAKMLEYNADTPTSLYESAAFQWMWLEEMKESQKLPRFADQFNSIEDKMVDAWRKFGIQGVLHLAHQGESMEDCATVDYIEGLAVQAGIHTKRVTIENIGMDVQNRLTDMDDYVIQNLFKLYPWEWLVTEPGGNALLQENTRIIEPAWKMVLSNKGLLPILWKLFPNHPNLLPAFFADDMAGLATLHGNYVRKPIFSREGANVEIIKGGETEEMSQGEYGEEGCIVQAFHPLPKFDESYAVIGSWVVASQPAGIGIREDNSLITKNTSRFVPHFIA